MPRFGPIEGRVTDTMRDGEGNPVEGILFNILFLNLHNHARQFQVVQHPDRSLTVRIVPYVAGKLPRDAEGLIRRFVQEHMRGVNLRIQLVNELPLTKAGKLRRVVVEQPTPIELRKAGVGEGRRTFGQPTLSGSGLSSRVRATTEYLAAGRIVALRTALAVLWCVTQDTCRTEVRRQR